MFLKTHVSSTFHNTHFHYACVSSAYTENLRKNLHENLRQSLAMLFVLLCVFLTPTPPSYAASPAITPYADQIKETNAAIKALERKKRSLEKDYSSTEKALKRLASSLSKAQRNLNGTQADLREQQRALTELQADIAETEEKITNEQDALKQQLRTAYQQGTPHPLEILLSEQQPDTWGQIAIYHQAFISARDQRFNHLLALRAQKQSQEAQLKTITQELTNKAADEKVAIAQLTALRQEHAALSKKLKKEQSATGTSLSGLRKEHQQLEALLAEWKSRQVIDRPFADAKGKLKWPVKGSFSTLSNPNTNSGRKGVFISAKSGTVVKAVHSGQIIFSDWLRGFGMMCIIDHGDGYLSLYGHNESLTRQVGEHVQTGDQIGTVGHSGGQSVPGVYFELRHNGKATNAKQWLARVEP